MKKSTLIIKVVGVMVTGSVLSSHASASCSPWTAGQQYYTGDIVSYNGSHYIAVNDNPGYDPVISTWYWDPYTGSACDSSGSSDGDSGSCPAWVAGQQYYTGDIVEYSGSNYIAEHDNPGYDPVISTWYWDPTTQNCGGNDNGGGGSSDGSFVVSETQFNTIFPGRNSFYTYQGLVDALSTYPEFAATGSIDTQKREAAAFLANIGHETSGLVYVVEQNTANYSHYCDLDRPYGCPAGQSAYYGRGPIQLSWNYNYKLAGDALGLDLLNSPQLVEQNPAIAMKTGIWYWMTQNGPGTMTPHSAMVNGHGFGETIRSINGGLECNGGRPDQVQDRIDRYINIIQILGTTEGPGNLGC